MAHPASINKLPHTAYVDSLGSIAEAITIPSTPPYTHMLGQSAPANYPAGYQIVPSATPGAVSVTGGGYGSWAQVTGSPAGGQFAVDTTTTPTGGTITFSATDASKSVTINWTAALLPNEQWLEDIWNALHDIVSAEGAANGFSMLDSLGRIAATAANALTVNGALTLNGHVAPRDGSPTVAAGSGFTSPNTVAKAAGFNSSDSSGALILSPSGSHTVGAGAILATVTFATAFGSIPKVFLQGQTSSGAPFFIPTPEVGSVATTGFTILNGGGSFTMTSPGIVYYHCDG